MILERADAVLPAGRAAAPARRLYDLVERRPRRRMVTVLVEHERRVEVAVAGVTERGDLHAVALGDVGNVRHGCGQFTYRHTDVVENGGSTLFQR